MEKRGSTIVRGTLASPRTCDRTLRLGLCRSAIVPQRFRTIASISTTEHLLGVRSVCGDLDARFALPPSWEGLETTQLAEQRAHLLAEVRAQETEVADERKRRGLARPHVEQILRRTHHDHRPENPKRGRKPLCFASSFPVADAFRRTWNGWVEAYRAASEAFRAGIFEVMFPARALPPRLTRPPTEAPA